MTQQGQARLERARRELAAIRLLADAGFTTQAVARAYYAAFYAAEAALRAVGQSRSRHAAVIAAFGQHVIKDSGMDRSHGLVLRTLFDRRNAADYDEPDDAGAADAKAAIDQATAFVDAVAKWLDARDAS
jgi:uncharacterized protein (UPF0332 family)